MAGPTYRYPYPNAETPLHPMASWDAPRVLRMERKWTRNGVMGNCQFDPEPVVGPGMGTEGFGERPGKIQIMGAGRGKDSRPEAGSSSINLALVLYARTPVRNNV